MFPSFLFPLESKGFSLAAGRGAGRAESLGATLAQPQERFRRLAPRPAGCLTETSVSLLRARSRIWKSFQVSLPAGAVVSLAKEKHFSGRNSACLQPPLLPKPCGVAAGIWSPIFKKISRRLIGLAPRPDAIPIRSHAPGWASQGARPGFFFGGSFPGQRVSAGRLEAGSEACLQRMPRPCGPRFGPKPFQFKERLAHCPWKKSSLHFFHSVDTWKR